MSDKKLWEQYVALEKERDTLRSDLAEFQYAAAVANDTIKALQAKIEAMERQEPVMWANSSNINSSRINKERGGRGDQHTCSETQTTYHDAQLYALPGAQAQPAQKAVAYLDLGVGGYVDVGTDLTDEALAALPKGRHMLGIVGTYGVDGYVPAQPAPSVPDGVAEALQRLIENGAVLGPGSSEDALLVARYRQHLLSSAPSISPAALRPVIQWLRNGCDPMKAAKELEILIAAAPEAKP